jgi:hypothetical protein
LHGKKLNIASSLFKFDLWWSQNFTGYHDQVLSIPALYNQELPMLMPRKEMAILNEICLGVLQFVHMNAGIIF